MGEMGDVWFEKEIASGMAATGVEYMPKVEEVGFDWEKYVPTVDEASDAVLDGWRCPLGRLAVALGV